MCPYIVSVCFEVLQVDGLVQIKSQSVELMVCTTKANISNALVYCKAHIYTDTYRHDLSLSSTSTGMTATLVPTPSREISLFHNLCITMCILNIVAGIVVLKIASATRDRLKAAWY